MKKVDIWRLPWHRSLYSHGEDRIGLRVWNCTEGRVWGRVWSRVLKDGHR